MPVEHTHPHPWKTQDPDWGNPDRKGMLLSDQIRKFCTTKHPDGLLISDGYEEGKLRPAAFTLTIGDDYADSEGKQKKLSDEEPSFEMPPNSIVFVSIAETLDLPYYIAARFNLRVDWVYKGVLLGTGPQVEPGFKGKLSCPLYNLTNRSHTIVRGEDFATIDFERTTNFVNELPENVETNIEKKGKVYSYQSGETEFLLFDQKFLKPLGKYPKDYKIVSSLAQMQRDLTMWRRIGIGIVVSFIALTLSLLGSQSNLLREVASTGKDLAQSRIDNERNLSQLKIELADTKRELDKTKDQLNGLREEVRQSNKK